MLDTGTWISLGSSAVVIVSLWRGNQVMMQNLKDSLTELKLDIREEVKKEKDHAMSLSNQRIMPIEKDVNEIFPRLRIAEEGLHKNCFAVTNLIKECQRKHKEIL